MWAPRRVSEKVRNRVLTTESNRSGKSDLVITLRGGHEVSVNQFRGFVVVVGFVSKAACHTGPSMEVLDEIFLDVGPSVIRCFACIVDQDPGEPVREYSPFAIQIGAAPRRAVAQFLRVSMSGFYLPQFLVIDRQGKQRHRAIACGEEFGEIVRNFRLPIDQIVAEPWQPDNGTVSEFRPSEPADVTT